MAKAHHDIAAPTSRRNFLRSGSAAIAALAIPTLANAAPAFGLDAELVELGQQLETVSAQWWKSGELVSHLAKVAEDQYPQLPDVLKSRPEDKQFGLPKPNDGRWYRPIKGGNRNEPGYYTINHLHELKQFEPSQRKEVPFKQYHREKFGPDAPFVFHDLDNDIVVSLVPWPEAQARVDELIAAIEDWRKACRKIDHAVGYMKADREFQRLANQDHNLLKKICKTEAKSLEGILVKVRAVKLIHRDDDLIEFGDATNEVLAASVLNELLALQGVTA
jgi:hypothetical protein